MRLNDFAVGPPTIDFTSCASDAKASSRPRNAFVASIVDLALDAAHLRERLGDLAGRNRDDDHVGIRRVAAVAAELLHVVPRRAPALREPAAHVPPADDGDLHGIPFRRWPPEYPTILDLVGETPIVRLDKLSPRGGAQLLAKLEYLNPGGSVKDRIGLPMIEAAEREGKLQPGGTIVEPTSGNTGVGLAIAAAIKGYRCIFVMPDKMSQEKIALLRAYGAEVVITPTAVEHDSPECYYSVSDRLAEEIPGGFKPDQYSNMNNPEAHYRVTGPEIWEQTGGEIDALVISVGTGGTISGVGRYFKEQKPEIAHRRRRSRGLGVHGEERARRASVPRRGHRQGHVARDDGPEGRRRVGPRRRPRVVPVGAPPRARGGHPRRRLGRDRVCTPAIRSRGASARASACSR